MGISTYRHGETIWACGGETKTREPNFHWALLSKYSGADCKKRRTKLQYKPSLISYYFPGQRDLQLHEQLDNTQTYTHPRLSPSGYETQDPGSFRVERKQKMRWGIPRFQKVINYLLNI